MNMMCDMDTNTTIPVEKLVRIYIRMRDASLEAQKKFDAEQEELKGRMREIANALKDTMKSMGDGLTSLKTDSGTVILTTKTRFYAQDWNAFKAFVIEHNAVDLFERRIAQKNMAQFITDNPEDYPPGLAQSSETEVVIRRVSSSAG